MSAALRITPRSYIHRDHSGETTGTIGLKPGDSEDFNDFLMDIFNTQITSNSIDFHYSLEHPENYGLSMDEVTSALSAWITWMLILKILRMHWKRLENSTTTSFL